MEKNPKNHPVWDGANWDGAVLCNLHKQNSPPEMLSALRGGTAEMLLSHLLLKIIKKAKFSLLRSFWDLVRATRQKELSFMCRCVCM